MMDSETDTKTIQIRQPTFRRLNVCAAITFVSFAVALATLGLTGCLTGFLNCTSEKIEELGNNYDATVNNPGRNGDDYLRGDNSRLFDNTTSTKRITNAKYNM